MTTPTNGARVVDPAGVLFGIVLPVLAAAAGVVLTYVLEPRLPDEIATHWSGDSPDGYMSPVASAWTVAALVVVVGGGCCAIAALAQAQLMTRRVMLIVGLAVVGLMVAAQITTVVEQLDASAATDSPLPVSGIVSGVVAGAVAGLIGASRLRDQRVRSVATEPPPASLPRRAVDLPVSDQVGMSAGGLLATGLAVTAPAALVCWLAGAWWPLWIYVPIVVLGVALLQFRLVVDADGIRVQNMGMSAIEYGTDEVLSARVVEIRPFQDFGGWGLKRKGPGNYGVVTRTGPAVLVTFANGDRLTVTTPRADEIAGALNSLADRRPARP
ncbi:DUF1648 domain-containing protein [Rhodococcus sp. SGAir0479]|uniref:DUF1648 domain-containing protein n=1 Tax=Rhodococcus sp. SGAir0479 TaxID=2567884 RepID=UPI0010CD0E1C|nr:DUF1648 domain-containing protein [Rhodococcus sp. SGAir0479]QCQ93010.1 DUF1648 domain-containing protein [Rhodococcus sp. SGAir0479]